jgi:hypothetical protein
MSRKPSVSPSPSYFQENKNTMSDISEAPSVSPSPSKIRPGPRKPPATYPRTLMPQKKKKTTLPTVSFEPTMVNNEAIMTSISRITSPPTNVKASATLFPSNSILFFVDSYPFSICLNSTIKTSDTTVLFKQLTDFYNTYINYYMPDDSGFRYISLQAEEKGTEEEGIPLMSIDIQPRVYYSSSAAYPPSKQVINGLIRNSTLDVSELGLLAYLKAHTNGLDSVKMTPCLSNVPSKITNDEVAAPSQNIPSLGTIWWVLLLIVALGAGCLVLFARRRQKPQPTYVQENSSSKSIISETMAMQRNESKLDNNNTDNPSHDAAPQEEESAEIKPEEPQIAQQPTTLTPNDPATDLCLNEAFTEKAERKRVVRFDDLILFHTISQCPYSPRLSEVFSDESSLPDFLLNTAKDDDYCFQTLDYVCCEGHQDDYHVFSQNEHHVFRLDDL